MNKLTEQQRKHFNDIAEDYYEAINDRKAEYFRKLVYKELFRNTSLKKKLLNGEKIKVLEAMCGFGFGRYILKALFVNAQFEYEGFDYSDEVVRIVKEKYPNENFSQQDVNTFISDKEYDVIILLSGLHHVPNTAAQVVKNMYNCLKDGGTFINVEPTHNNFISRIICDRIYKHSKFYDYETERRFSLVELNSMYSDAGFKIERQIYPGIFAYLLWWYNPYPLFRKIGNKKFVKKLFKFERPMYHNWIGKKFSVATFTVLHKE